MAGVVSVSQQKGGWGGQHQQGTPLLLEHQTLIRNLPADCSVRLLGQNFAAMPAFTLRSWGGWEMSSQLGTPFWSRPRLYWQGRGWAGALSQQLVVLPHVRCHMLGRMALTVAPWQWWHRSIAFLADEGTGTQGG